MSTFLIILIVFAAVLLILLVLVQNSKGGGLASGFASGNQVMGAPKTADFLEKATWGLIAVVVLLSIATVGVMKHEKKAVKDNGSNIEVVNDSNLDANQDGLNESAEEPEQEAEL